MLPLPWFVQKSQNGTGAVVRLSRPLQVHADRLVVPRVRHERIAEELRFRHPMERAPRGLPRPRGAEPAEPVVVAEDVLRRRFPKRLAPVVGAAELQELRSDGRAPVARVEALVPSGSPWSSSIR